MKNSAKRTGKRLSGERKTAGAAISGTMTPRTIIRLRRCVKTAPAVEASPIRDQEKLCPRRATSANARSGFRTNGKEKYDAQKISVARATASKLGSKVF